MSEISFPISKEEEMLLEGNFVSGEASVPLDASGNSGTGSVNGSLVISSHRRTELGYELFKHKLLKALLPDGLLETHCLLFHHLERGLIPSVSRDNWMFKSGKAEKLARIYLQWETCNFWSTFTCITRA